MASLSTTTLTSLVLASLLVLGASSSQHNTDFLECLTDQFERSNSATDVIFTPQNASYATLLVTENLRPASTSPERPSLIITPFHESEIQAAIFCSKKVGMQIRVRSGGHDYEGLSYTSRSNPFVVLDMRNFRSNATQLVHRWQYVAHKVDRNLLIRLSLRSVRSTTGQNITINAIFFALYLGPVSDLLPMMQNEFPELGLVKRDYIEMSWIESLLYFQGLYGQPLDVLLSRTPRAIFYRKAKSDFVTQPIPINGLRGIWRFLHDEAEDMAEVQFSPYGGAMDDLSESETPFPHRSGNIFMIHYMVTWIRPGNEELQRHLDWIRRLYTYMAPYVTNSPRLAYFNYKDLDLGSNNPRNTSYEQASVWGRRYFKRNFDRLVRIKSKFDPSNFFRNEQSIPPVTSSTSSSPHNISCFHKCLIYELKRKNSPSSSSPNSIIITPQNKSAYEFLLRPQNLRPGLISPLKPFLIITPQNETETQAVVRCSRKLGTQLRARAGDHDYEGLSYTSKTPFVMLDLRNLDSVTVDPKARTAWVQAGATLGQMYYAIARESKTLAFSGGICPSVGVGGNISGGGYGMLTRKYGLASDNVVDARLIGADGEISDRRSMPEELFWALRGGGGTSFGIVTAFKVKLVVVPKTVTVFTIMRTSKPKNNATTRLSDYAGAWGISTRGLQGMWRFLHKEDENWGTVELSPCGGVLSEEGSTRTSPYWSGCSFMIRYGANWYGGGYEGMERHVEWIRSFYGYMGAYVWTKMPRAAYINYRDLDLGLNMQGRNTSYEQARVWGVKYFGNNFERLARAKARVDSENLFWNEQSIPPLLM
ncbi:FAD-binding Berberine family protein [Striga asiatica]|uniref:FAD-binding Berberine family protein n=1 Tax=Striga asiatica TaxID=4170 RepID=A0A5A7NWI2_STRAF|nr:FAD-binding Berberine family protein [Striga asiatica]